MVQTKIRTFTYTNAFPERPGSAIREERRVEVVEEVSSERREYPAKKPGPPGRMED